MCVCYVNFVMSLKLYVLCDVFDFILYNFVNMYLFIKLIIKKENKNYD